MDQKREQNKKFPGIKILTRALLSKLLKQHNNNQFNLVQLIEIYLKLTNYTKFIMQYRKIFLYDIHTQVISAKKRKRKQDLIDNLFHDRERDPE